MANFDTATAVEAGGIANATAGTDPSGNVLTNDTDVDAGDSRTVTGNVVGVATAAVGNAVTGSYGSITINSNGTYTYTVDNSNATVQALRIASETISDVFTYTITDAAGGTSSSQITVTIEGANDAPVISVGGSDSAAKSITETNATLTTSGTLTVTDLDTTDVVTSSVTGLVASGDTTGLASDNAAAVGHADIHRQRVGRHANQRHPDVEFDSDSETFDYLAADESLTLTYTIEVADIAGAKHTQDVVVTINGSNDAPVITDGPDSVTLTETNAGLTSTGSLTVTDLDRTDTVTAAVDSVAVTGTGSTSVPISLTNTTIESYLSVSPTAILDNTETSATLTWNFDSGSEAFNFSGQRRNADPDLHRQCNR